MLITRGFGLGGGTGTGPGLPTPIAIFPPDVIGDSLGVKSLGGQNVVPSLKGTPGITPSIRSKEVDEDEFDVKIDIFPPPNLG